jgi:hypothetical protein
MCGMNKKKCDAHLRFAAEGASHFLTFAYCTVVVMVDVGVSRATSGRYCA